jgi:hypothetical protein
MGFMDKAKKLAEQAQSKLDEVQTQFNEKQSTAAPAGPAVEYDKHGRPVPASPAETTTPPHGDPLGEAPAAPPPAPPAPTPDASAPTAQEDPGKPSSSEPPKMSSGDPLAG